MKIYNVYQSGKRLYIDEKENPDNKIVVNKYDNEQQTLRLVSDGTLPPRLYWALRNPRLSQKYFILPLINNEDLIVGTDISATHGLWDMLLIGTGEDYIIEGTDIDQSRLTYVSDHFGRLFVRDNFLEELDFEEQCSPTFKIFYDEIMFSLENKAEMKDIPDQLSDLENDTNFISGVTFKDDGEGHVEIIGTTFGGGETEEGEIPSGSSIEVDDKLDEESTNPVQNQVVTKEIKTLKDKDESLDKEILTLREENEALEQKNAELESSIEKLQIKQTTDKAPFHHITDSANMKVLDFGMEGKTTQDGTPTPENQVEIVNAGVYNEETGRYEIGCVVGNKNFATELIRGLLTDEKGTISTESAYYTDNFSCIKRVLPKGVYTINIQGMKIKISRYIIDGQYVNLSSSGMDKFTFTVSDVSEVIICFSKGDGSAFDGSELVQLELSDTQTDYTPHASQPFTLTSPVPLTKWDKLVKRDGVWGWSIQSKEYNLSGYEVSMDGNNADGTKVRLYVSNAEAYINSECYCNMIRKANDTSIGYCGYWFDGRFCIMALNSWLEPYGYTYDESSNNNATNAIAAFKAMLNDNPIQIWVDMQEEQSFHPLPDEEQELLKNLETYYGVTNVYNEQGCPMWLCYTCDSKLYVDKKLEQINNALLSLGANV